LYIGKPFYKAFDGAPIKLQAHGDKSEPISFRNFWVRELTYLSNPGGSTPASTTGPLLRKVETSSGAVNLTG